MKNYKYLLFDLDGTLTYSHPGIYNCIRYALEAFGRPQPTEKQLRACVGPPLTYSFSEIFGMSEEETEGLFENEPIPGAAELLASLKQKGYVQAIATSKPKIFAERIADKFNFTPFLDAVAGSGTDGSFPTKASVIDEAVRLLGAEKSACLMIGDRKHDAEGARACGVDFAGLKTGYAEDGELEAEPSAGVFADFGELAAFLSETAKN